MKIKTTFCEKKPIKLIVIMYNNEVQMFHIEWTSKTIKDLVIMSNL